jgi:hypothetical protein
LLLNNAIPQILKIDNIAIMPAILNGAFLSPSAVVIPGDGIYVFHQGIDNVLTGPSGDLWYSHFHFDNST